MRSQIGDGLALEDGDHLFVRRLVEAVVPAADGVEAVRNRCAHDSVRHCLEPRARGRGTDGCRDDDALGAAISKRHDGRFGRRARRKPVVDNDHRAAVKRRKRSRSSIHLVASIELDAFANRHLLDRRAWDVELANEILA